MRLRRKKPLSFIITPCSGFAVASLLGTPIADVYGPLRRLIDSVMAVLVRPLSEQWFHGGGSATGNCKRMIEYTLPETGSQGEKDWMVTRDSIMTATERAILTKNHRAIVTKSI
jgi:hypothetical protein